MTTHWRWAEAAPPFFRRLGTRTMNDDIPAGMETRGYTIVEGVVTVQECDQLAERIRLADDRSAGSRCLLDCAWCRDLGVTLRSELAKGVPRLRQLALVQCTYFEKSPERNWLVAWHQDRSIPVDEASVPLGQSGHSHKEGVTYVHGPDAVLGESIAVRLHLDDSLADNGPLRVIPGSHREGTLAEDAMARIRGSVSEDVCLVKKGGVLMICPLLLHASSKSRNDLPRRVLHFLYAPRTLPSPLRWRVSI